jgi:AcrR family transcriptional regulator
MRASPDRTTPKKRRRRARGRPRAADTDQRERLLDAAIRCFTQRGIAATSLRSIAQDAGVTPALVHYYFGNKQQLLDAFVAERLLPLVAEVAGGLRSAGDATARALVVAFVHGMHAAVERAPWWPALWVREVIGENGALRDVLFGDYAGRVPQVLAARFAELKKRGQLAADLDPRLLMVSLIGLTLFPLAAAPIWRRVFDASDIDAALLERHTLALLDHGLGASHEP